MSRRKKRRAHIDWLELFTTVVERGYKHDEEGNIIGVRGKKLVLSANPINGYLRFYVCVKRVNGKATVRTIPVHRFVAWCKFGREMLDRKLVVRHMDGNRTNNRPENLEIGTYSDNMQDRLRHAAEEEPPF